MKAFSKQASLTQKRSVFTTSKMDRQILRQKVRQRISLMKTYVHTMFPENWHFRSCFVLKTTKTPLLVFITEIL